MDRRLSANAVWKLSLKWCPRKSQCFYIWKQRRAGWTLTTVSLLPFTKAIGKNTKAKQQQQQQQNNRWGQAKDKNRKTGYDNKVFLANYATKRHFFSLSQKTTTITTNQKKKKNHAHSRSQLQRMTIRTNKQHRYLPEFSIRMVS